MTLHWPQLTLLTIYALSLGVALSEWGTLPPARPRRIWPSLVAVVVVLFLLTKGGFFG